MKRFVAWSIFFLLAARPDAGAQGKGDADTVIAWGKASDGLKIGIAIDTAEADQNRLPKLKLYLVNAGDHGLQGIIQSAGRCVIVLNGICYAVEDFGGKSSAMPPGRRYGPIEIDFHEFHQMPPLADIAHVSRINIDVLRSTPLPKLRKGKNTISVYFIFGARDESMTHSGDVVFDQLK